MAFDQKPFINCFRLFRSLDLSRSGSFPGYYSKELVLHFRTFGYGGKSQILTQSVMKTLAAFPY